MPATTLPLNAGSLANLAIDNQQIPNEGSKAVPVLLDFTVSNQYTLDLQNIQSRGFLSMIQTMYIDMSASDVPMIVNINGSQQNITAKGRTQGYYTVMCPNPVKLTFTCA